LFISRKLQTHNFNSHPSPHDGKKRRKGKDQKKEAIKEFS